MAASTRLEQLIQCFIHVVGRAAIAEDKVREVVATGRKQVEAFNLCDGTRTQAQVAKAAGLDQGNLSRAITRWTEHGVAYWIGEGKDARLLHVYQIPLSSTVRLPSNRLQAKRTRRANRK